MMPHPLNRQNVKYIYQDQVAVSDKAWFRCGPCHSFNRHYTLQATVDPGGGMNMGGNYSNVTPT